MDSKWDIRRMLNLAQTQFHFASEANISHLLNKNLTMDSLNKKLTHFRSQYGPKFAYGNMIPDSLRRSEQPTLLFTQQLAVMQFRMMVNISSVYLPTDYAEGASTDNLFPRGIKSNELGRLLLDPASPDPTRMILVTDICYASNFLSLPYALRRSGDTFYWHELKEANSRGQEAEHRILHFTGGAPSTATYSFKKAGSLFVREFYNVGVGEAVSLSDRIKKMQNGVNAYLEKYNTARGQNLHQEMQLYSSHKFVRV
ncbi:hypothetical protein FRC07_000127, partial [Ceratobasidium sp. 392]